MNQVPELSRPVTADEYAAIERAFAELLATRHDLIVIQGEAALPLEAAARGLGGPGVRALNIVTGPYGVVFADWLRQAGAEVEDLAVEFDQAVTVELVEAALDRLGRIDVLSVVHAEAATGSLNPLAEIVKLAHAAGALAVVDAVASVGADPLEIDRWGLDLTVLSAQKALAGPTGASAVIVNERAWEQLERNPAAPRRSVLSLLDWKEHWVDPGCAVLPVIPHHAETRLLGQALDLALDETLVGVVARHGAARDACRRGLRALGLEPWVRDDAQATAVATTFRLPRGIAPAQLLEAVHASRLGSAALPIGVAPRSLADHALRVSHTGRQATQGEVVSVLGALGLGLRSLGLPADVGAAVEAALDG